MVNLADTAPDTTSRKRVRKAGTLNRVLMVLLLTVVAVWLFVPFTMAVLWSLVDPETGWNFPDLLPPKLTLLRWTEVWTTTALPQAIANSYMLAPTVAVTTLILASPATTSLAKGWRRS